MHSDCEEDIVLGGQAMVALPGEPLREERRTGNDYAVASEVQVRPWDYADDSEEPGDDLDERDRDLREMIRQIFALRWD
jgi:hypothetical protein